MRVGVVAVDDLLSPFRDHRRSVSALAELAGLGRTTESVVRPTPPEAVVALVRDPGRAAFHIAWLRMAADVFLVLDRPPPADPLAIEMEQEELGELTAQLGNVRAVLDLAVDPGAVATAVELAQACPHPPDRSPPLLGRWGTPNPLTWVTRSGEVPVRGPSHKRPIGHDEHGRYAWTGRRCAFDWYVVGPEGPAFLCAAEHDWPIGHAKKLFGYLDNEPVSIAVDPEGERVLSVFERDALLRESVPLRWRRARAVWLAEAWPDARRAVFWTHADEVSAHVPDDEEDRRGGAPAIALLPERRYVIGLHDGLVRREGDRIVEDRPATERWQIRDADHRVLVDHPGRLVGTQDGLVVFRLDGQRRSAAPEDLLD